MVITILPPCNACLPLSRENLACYINKLSLKKKKNAQKITSKYCTSKTIHHSTVCNSTINKQFFSKFEEVYQQRKREIERHSV